MNKMNISILEMNKLFYRVGSFNEPVERVYKIDVWYMFDFMGQNDSFSESPMKSSQLTDPWRPMKVRLNKAYLWIWHSIVYLL